MAELSLAESVLWSYRTAVVVIDEARSVSYANQAALRLLAPLDGAVESRDIVELLGDDKNFARAIESARNSQEDSHLRFMFSRDGEHIELGLSVSPSFDELKPQAVMISIYHIEHCKLLDTRTRQVEKVAFTERLIGGFAHQLRNPLAAISALVENLVAETPSSDPRTEYTSRLLNQVMQMERLIRACLTFRSDASAVRKRSTVEKIGQTALDMFHSQQDVLPRLVVEAGTPDVVVNEEQIVECLCLLLRRALDTCHDASKIELHVAPEPLGGTSHLVRFVVRDEGPMIAKEDLAMIFEPFYTTKARGVGMGLATAQALAVQNGGTLNVQSTSGDTQFILRLDAFQDQDRVSSPTPSYSPTFSSK